MKETVVISIGGSIIVPKDIDHKFLKEAKRAISKISRQYKLVICTGGGSTAREYISALRDAGCAEMEQNLIGIAVTRINARLLASYLNCSSDIPVSLAEVRSKLRKDNVVVCGGLTPGQTSDGTTAEIAEYLGVKTLINVTNVSGLYTKDPRKFKGAKLIPKIGHAEFSKIMAKVREGPGQHFVLDSVAERIAKRNKMRVIILKGMANLENYLSGKRFVGTVID